MLKLSELTLQIIQQTYKEHGYNCVEIESRYHNGVISFIECESAKHKSLLDCRNTIGDIVFSEIIKNS